MPVKRHLRAIDGGGVGGVGDDEDGRVFAARQLAAEILRDLDGEIDRAGKDQRVDLLGAGQRIADVEIIGGLAAT